MPMPMLTTTAAAAALSSLPPSSFLLSSGRFPLRAQTKPPFPFPFPLRYLPAARSPSPIRPHRCARAPPLAPISSSLLPLRSPVSPPDGDGGGGTHKRIAMAAAAAALCGVLVAVRCHRALAAGAAAGTAPAGIGGLALGGAWPRVLQILQLLREQGLVLAALLGLSAFFSMAETAITTLWPWKMECMP